MTVGGLTGLAALVASPRTGAAALAERVRRGELSAVEILDAYLARIDALEPRLRAWETLDRDAARRAASRVDALPPDARGPLAGVPFAVKDVVDTAGLRTAGAFAPFDRRVPDRDATVVARLRAAGAVLVGKTTTTQFANGAPTGTANPWRLDRTPGGSSSGSGAAVGAAMVPLAVGSQTGGSTLRPAAYCGAVGLKPSYGRLSRAGVFPLGWSCDHVGLIGRRLADVALALRVAAGADPADRSTLDRLRPLGRLGAPRRPPRLAVLVDLVEQSAPGVRASVAEAVGGFEAAGATVRELRLPLPLDDVLAVLRTIVQVEAASYHATWLEQHRNAYEPELRDSLEVGRLLPASVYLSALRWRGEIREQLEARIGPLDVVLSPTARDVAPDRATTGDPDFQSIWSLVGAPAVSLPSGLDAAGLPLAIQLATPRGRDAALLRTAAWCEPLLPALPLLG